MTTATKDPEKKLNHSGTYIPKEFTTKLQNFTMPEHYVGIYISERMYSYQNKYQFLTIEEIQKGYVHNDELVVQGTGLHEKTIKKAIKGLVKKGVFLTYCKQSKIRIDDDICFFHPTEDHKILIKHLEETAGENYRDFRNKVIYKALDSFIARIKNLAEKILPKEESKIQKENCTIPLENHTVPSKESIIHNEESPIPDYMPKTIDLISVSGTLIKEDNNKEEIIKKTSSIKTVEAEQNFIKTESKNDDDFLNYELEEEERRIIEETRKRLRESSDKLTTTQEDIESEIKTSTPQKDSVDVVGDCGQLVDKEKEELLLAFKNLKNKAGQPANYDIVHAEAILNNPATDRNFVRRELKYYPYRVDKNGNAIHGGYLRIILNNGFSEVPPAYNETVVKKEVEEAENKYQAILDIWKPGEKISDIRAIKTFLKTYINSDLRGKLYHAVQEKLNKMKAICDLSEVLSTDTLKLVEDFI